SAADGFDARRQGARRAPVPPHGCEPALWVAALGRYRIPDAYRRNGIGTVRADWPRRAFVLAHDARTGRATGGRGDGAGESFGNCRPYAGSLDHPARGLPPGVVMCEILR